MNTVIALRIDDDIVGSIATLLAHARQQAGLSQRELATLAGVTHGMINTYEAGRRHPSITTLTRLLCAAGSTVHLEINRAEPAASALPFGAGDNARADTEPSNSTQGVR